MEILQSRSAGDVANAYEQSRARVAVILGPVGGGKTISSSKKCIRVARMQEPSPRDGIRRARIVVLARTYGDIWDKVLPSYRKTYPASMFGEIKGSQNRQADHVYDIREPGKGILHVEVLFRAVQDIDLEDFVRGMECTAWWLTEMDTLPQAIVELAAQRVGRYPEPDDRPEPEEGQTERPLAYAGVFGDANVPDIDDWFYNQFWLAANRPSHWHLFLQPSAILPGGPPWLQNPNAENLQNLRKADPNWYATQARDMQAWQIRRFLQCKPGYSRHATPVHELFDEVRHVAAGRIQIDPYKPMIIGADGGGGTLHPSAAFMQNPRPMQWRVNAEFAPQERCSVEEFAHNILRVMNTQVKRSAGAIILGDPAMAQGMTFGGGGGGFSIQTYGQKLQALTGIEVQLAPSNKPAERRGALAKVLKEHDGFSCDPRVTYLIRALAGGFRYRKRAGDKVLLEPEKNMHSHIAEGCEYGVLGGEGMTGFFGGLGGDHGVPADLMPPPIM
ncbi:hypothetical protein [Brevundimonas sp.]|uniref:hypothetical protein n=1 Tax=Brevundimonas sp. TaxID=1871086 RepID=UPI00260423F7|nr:hypothetical protein [Brevundimonas sp.]